MLPFDHDELSNDGDLKTTSRSLCPTDMQVLLNERWFLRSVTGERTFIACGGI